MATTTTIPITVTEEAAARVAELGMQREFEQMLEHTVQTVPDLKSVEVILAPPYDTGDYPRVILEASRTVPLVPPDETESQWWDWQIGTFPPRVCAHFLMQTLHGECA